MTTDKPAADTDRYLERGNKMVMSAMTKKDWQPGQLIGPDGSNPATMAQSPSYLPPERYNDLSERRSATSTSHILQYKRPTGVSLDWGGYDELTSWQSFGRRVSKDMVEKQDWPSTSLPPVRFLNDSGKVVKTIQMLFELQDLLPSGKIPETLYDKMNNRKTTGQPRATFLAFPGTEGADDE